MNTRSKGPIVDGANIKPYKTNINSKSTKNADIVTELTIMSSTTPESEVDLKNLTSDQKLDFLIHTVTKLTSIPAVILDINKRITELSASVNEIPNLEKLAKETEASLQLNTTAVTENKVKIAGIETSLNHTQNEVDTMGKTIKEIQIKLKANERSIKMIESKVNVNEDLLAVLEKQFEEMHSNKDVKD